MSTTPARALTRRRLAPLAARRAALPDLRSLAAAGGLVAVVGGALAIALAAAGNDLIVDTAGADEPAWIAGAFSGLVPGLSDTGFSLAMLAMLAGYLTLVSFADRLAPRLVLGGLAMAALGLVLAPPLLSSDLFGYIGYGRLGALHHLNPYRHGVIAAPRDPVVPLVYWMHPSSPYGPLFTLGSYVIAPRSLPVQVWTLKAVGGLAWLSSVAVAWRAARLWGRPPLRAAVLLGANPLLLVYGVGGAHNDLIVMAVVTAALALLAARRGAAAGATLALAAGVKATGGLLLPFVLAGSRPRARVAAGFAATGAALAGLTLAAFGPHVLDTIGSIAVASRFRIDWSGPDAVGRLLGTGVTAGVRAAAAASVLAVVVLGARSIRRGGDWLAAAGWAVLALLCAIASFVPWYVAWVLPAAALARSRSLRVAVLALTAAVVATHLPLLGFAPYE